MAMTAGTKPTNYTSESSSDMQGMTKDIYDSMYPDVIAPSLKALPSESPESKINVIKSFKLMAYAIASGIIKNLKRDMEIKGVSSKLDSNSVNVNAGQAVIAGVYPGTTTSPGTGTVVSTSVSQSGSVHPI